MPITDIGSYVTTGQEIDSHWVDVDADRVANNLPAFAQPDGYNEPNLAADIQELTDAITAQESLDNALSIAVNARDALKAALRQRMIDFRKQINYQLKDSVYATSLQRTPHPDASEQKTLRALDDMEDLWERLNADSSTPNFTPPLVYADGYAVAAFQADVAALRAQYKAVVDAENDARMGRKRRDALLDPLRDRLVAYRQGIEVEYGPDHPFTQSLPDVYPLPGSTPNAVTLQGVFNGTTNMADLSWTASAEPTLLNYQVRGSQGTTYNAETAQIIATLDPGITTFSTNQGLNNPGDTMTFKVFVVLSTLNEAGSNAVTVTRP